MSDLADSLDAYLAMRRSLGYKLERVGQELARFVAYLDECHQTHITTESAVGWATRPGDAGPRWRAQRLGYVRCFARYLHGIDPAHQVPPAGILPPGRHRRDPYLFSPAEIDALMGAARDLASPLRAITLETLIGLLAVTGLRVGEAIRLNRSDIDTNMVSVVVSKANRSRIVPVTRSTSAALGRYSARRDELCAKPAGEAFFVSRAGTRLRSSNLGTVFAGLCRQTGLAAKANGKGPRLGDLRHAFAVTTVTDWHYAGVDAQAHLPLLSTYLGHASPTSTYWYLTASPELLRAAASRLETVAAPTEVTP